MTEPAPNTEDFFSAPEAELTGGETFADSAVSLRSWQVLGGTRPWVWVAGVALTLIGTLLAGAMIYLFFAINQMGSASIRGTVFVAIILTLIASWIFIHLGIRLFRFALAITRALEVRDELTLSRALDRHRLFWIMLCIPAILFSVLFVMSEAFL